MVMESSGGAHFMARRIADSDHETKMISPQFVRLYCQEQQKRFCRC
ncbi:Transposase [Erwinia tracheiphila PSU-1]|nr:Transposase [Erwinia tracheiphila PSU-1]